MSTNNDLMYSIDYQRQILRMLCSNLRFFSDYGSLLKATYFETEPSRTLFSIITKHVLAYEKELDQNDLIVKIDEYVTQRGFSSDTLSLLKEEVKDIFRTYIKSEQFIIDTLVTFCRRQELITAIYKSIDMLAKDPENAYEKVLKEIDQAVSVGTGSASDGLNFGDLINLQDHLKKRYAPEKLYKTGIAKYDEALGGGFAPGELHCIMASPKSGKSTLGANIGAYGVIQGKTVFHVTLEISDVDVANKYAIRLTGYTYAEMQQVQSDIYKDKIRRFEKYKGNLFINHWPEGTASVLNIRSWISKMRAKYGVKPDIIILDYDDCLRPVRGSKDDLYGDSGEIYKDLIGLAAHFNVPILTFAQPQRDAWNLPNNNENIRSFHISHSARKIHRLFSISSLNFKDDSKTGILYLDLNRRGESNVKIRMKRELYKGLFLQDE